jgi:ferredoxin
LIPGKDAVAKLVAELTGKAAAAVEPRIAMVKCAGSNEKAVRSFEYAGVDDCVAANLLFGGAKACKFGCLGLGTCMKNCPFGAMSMSEAGLPVIDPDKCTGCGKCETVCPKKVIAMMPLSARVRVNCSSRDKGQVARKACTAACIACTLCVRECPYQAVKVENNVAVVGAAVCVANNCAETPNASPSARPRQSGRQCWHRAGTEDQASVERACPSWREDEYRCRVRAKKKEETKVSSFFMRSFYESCSRPEPIGRILHIMLLMRTLFKRRYCREISQTVLSAGDRRLVRLRFP